MALSNTIQARDRLAARLNRLAREYDRLSGGIQTSARTQRRLSRLAREIERTQQSVDRLERLAETQATGSCGA